MYQRSLVATRRNIGKKIHNDQDRWKEGINVSDLKEIIEDSYNTDPN